jgi:hypothetical protein
MCSYAPYRHHFALHSVQKHTRTTGSTGNYLKHFNYTETLQSYNIIPIFQAKGRHYVLQLPGNVIHNKIRLTTTIPENGV